MEKYKLKGFTDYQEFLNYSHQFFHLAPEDEKGMEDLLYNAQELEDRDPIKMLQEIAYIEHHYHPNFAKFLVFIERDPEVGECVLKMMDDKQAAPVTLDGKPGQP